jgi:hypothetical protein
MATIAILTSALTFSGASRNKIVQFSDMVVLEVLVFIVDKHSFVNAANFFEKSER